MISLTFSKILKRSKIIKNFDNKIYYKIKYPENRIMIIDDNFDFNLLNSLFDLIDKSFITINIENDNDFDNMIIKYSSNKGIISKDFLFFKVNYKDIQKYGKIIKPNYILVGESAEMIESLETKEMFDSSTIIALSKYKFKDISYSIDDKNSDFYISNIDYIKEKIKINDKYDININKSDEKYLKEILMLFSFFISNSLDINIFNEVNFKKFDYDKKTIYMNINSNNYNDAIRFISRYTDYKVLVIAWKNLYDDISWLYNIEFERLLNKNIQKIYCIGTNAFDIATRLKYTGLNEKNILASANIDLFLKEITSYNLNIYVLADEYYLNIIKGGKK